MGVKAALLGLHRLWIGDPPIPHNVTIGTDTYIGPGVSLDWRFGHLIAIGDETTIVNGTRVLCHDASSNRRLGVTWCAPVSIGARVYIGADCLIMPGVVIGDDSVVAAGAVVTRDVAPGTVVAGVPASQISTTAELDAKRRALMASRPTFGREYHRKQLPPEKVEELVAAGAEGGYFLGRSR